MLDFAGFDWLNYILIVAMTPVVALFFYRVLTPKYSYKKTLWITLLFVMGITAINLSVAILIQSDSSIYAFTYSMAESVIYLLLFRCISRGSFGRLLLFYAVWVALSAFGHAAGTLTSRLVSDAAGPDSGISDQALFYIEICFVEVFQAIFLIVVSGWVSRRRKAAETDVRWSLFAIMLLTQIIAQMFLAMFLAWRKNVFSNVLLLCVYAGICVVADIYMLRVFRSMVKNAELQQNVALLNQQNALERTQYDAVGEQILTMRRLRHDYANTLSTISALADMGETDKIRMVISDTEKELVKTCIVRTGSPIVDAVLYSKQLIAAEKGVQINVGLLWPTGVSAPDTDLMRIFGNLIDNAIRYCETLPAGTERRIEVSNSVQGRMLALRFTNPYLGDAPPVIPESGSTSASAHGHGLAIVRDIAERNGGTLTASLCEKKLIFCVLLSLPQEVPESNI